jgi:hypothetical protein
MYNVPVTRTGRSCSGAELKLLLIALLSGMFEDRFGFGRDLEAPNNDRKPQKRPKPRPSVSEALSTWFQIVIKTVSSLSECGGFPLMPGVLFNARLSLLPDDASLCEISIHPSLTAAPTISFVHSIVPCLYEHAGERLYRLATGPITGSNEVPNKV